MTKLPDKAANTLEAMLDALAAGRTRIAYDTQSWKRFLQKEHGEMQRLTVTRQESVLQTGMVCEVKI